MRVLKRIRHLFAKIVRLLIRIIVAGGILAVLINLFVIGSTQSQVLSANELSQSKMVDNQTPILVLGAGVVNNAEPCEILAFRLKAAQEVYHYLPTNPYVMSGDHREDNYNEVQVMKDYLVKNGLPSNQIYLDHAGYSTYDSLYRLKHVMGQNKVIIVTQGYHLSRALLLAKGLGMDAVGVAAEESDQTRLQREFRETLARINDFANVYLDVQDKRPTSKYAVDLKSNGDWTDNKSSLPQ